MEGGENKKELEENHKEPEEQTEQSGQEEEEAEQQNGSPLQNSMQEDELAQILANMGEYAQAHSPLDPHIEEGPQEHFVHNKSASKELCDEYKGEEDHSTHDESIPGK